MDDNNIKKTTNELPLEQYQSYSDLCSLNAPRKRKTVQDIINEHKDSMENRVKIDEDKISKNYTEKFLNKSSLDDSNDNRGCFCFRN